jgi:ABC-type Fe3+-hydroxamate transport system substrate-binding protein
LRELYAATSGSFLAELIEIAGGKSAATPIHAGYGKLSKEAILTLNPELIIDVVHSPQSRFGENADEVWRDLPELRAVRERHVYSIRDEFLPHCSQFVVNTAERFARIIHPELFANQKRAAQ